MSAGSQADEHAQTVTADVASGPCRVDGARANMTSGPGIQAAAL